MYPIKSVLDVPDRSRPSQVAEEARGERESAAAGPLKGAVRSFLEGDAERRPPCTLAPGRSLWRTVGEDAGGRADGVRRKDFRRRCHRRS